VTGFGILATRGILSGSKITFQDDEVECDVQEIRELFDENEGGSGNA
jgi:hypothetical protein